MKMDGKDTGSIDDSLRPRPLYTRADLDGVPHLDSLPGAAPFLRGPHPTMYTERPWTIRQYAGFASAEESNAFFHASLREGGQGLSVAFDLPTHRGYDSDHPLAAADVGKAGVAIDSVEDMKQLFAGIALDATSVSMTMNGAVLPVLACFIVAAEESGVAAADLSGTIQNDILKEFMVRNTYIHAPEPSLRIAADVVEYVTRHMPRFNAMSISGYHFQEAGADAPLELALTIANAETYLKQLAARGLDIDRFCERLSFFFGVGRNFYVEIAKLRAARLLWCEVVEACGGRSDKARALRMHCQTSGWSLSAREPQNNTVRTTIEAMAAVFGGTQSLHTNSYDEALALPGDDAARLARNTQLILQHESGLCDVIDPWAGSYMMERLTHDIAAQTRGLLEEIAGKGGVVAALASGWISRRIDSAASRMQARIDSGEHVIVGENRFVAPTIVQAMHARRIDGSGVRAGQLARLARLRAERDADAVASSLAALKHCAAGGEGNLLELVIEAIRNRATLGECSAALEAVWPRYQAGTAFPREAYGGTRGGDCDWQSLRAEVRQRAARLRRRPRVLIAKLGLDGHDRGAKAVASALTDAGFEVIFAPLFSATKEIARRAVATAADLVGISSLAGAHLRLMQDFMQHLRDEGGAHIPVFLGGVVPECDSSSLLECGVAGMFSPGTRMDDIVSTLLQALPQEGVPASAPAAMTA
jgi:methylmalonyl-CoA mutase